MKFVRFSAVLASVAAAAVLVSGCSREAVDRVETTTASSPALAPSATPAPTPTVVTSEEPGPSDPDHVQPTSILPLVTIAGVDELRGFFVVGGSVGGVVEDGGTCTFIISNEATGSELFVSSTGVENVATTSCGSVDVARTEVPAGTYVVVLEYSSSKGSGRSEPIEVAVVE